MRHFALPVLCATALTLTGCLGGVVDSVNPLGPNPVTQQIDTMKSTAMVPYVVMFHPKPEVGQYAVTKTAMGESWIGIVGGKAGAWVLEKRDVVAGTDKKIATILLVNDKGEVSKAYAAPYVADAKEKPKAVEVKVMEKPKAQAAAATTPPALKWSKETVDGKTLDRCDVDKSTSWFSKDALFAQSMAGEPVPQGGVIKVAYDGKVVSEIIKQGTDKLAPSCDLP